MTRRQLVGRLFLFALLLPLLTRAAVGQRSEVYSVASMPDNSVVYALPQTRIYIQVQIEEVAETPGDLALYAQKHLGVRDAILKSNHHFELKGIGIGTYGVVDPESRYSVKFGRRHDATNVTLTADGILLGINAGEVAPEPIPEGYKKSPEARDRMTELSAFPSEYIQATTTARKADIVAEEIYNLRESRTAIISGESEQPFSDGKAMELAIERLDKAERVLVESFTGRIDRTEELVVVKGINPAVEGRQVAFRFSQQLGLLPADDLRGEPIYLDIKYEDVARELDEKEQKQLERHLRNGIVYRVPGEVTATLTWRGQELVRTRIAVAQLGTYEALDPNLFRGDLTTAVELHSTTGGIKRVWEERARE